MNSWGDLCTISQKLVADTTAATLVNLKMFLNIGIRDVRTKFKESYILEDQYTDLTEASVQYYPLPIDFHKAKWVKVLVGSVTYPLTEIQDYDLWNRLNQTTSSTSDVPTHFFTRYRAGRGEVGIFPIPTSADNTITICYTVDPPDLSVDDVTMTVCGLTNADATVTQAAAEFTEAMIDNKRWLQPGMATGGDNHWYQLLTFTSTSSVELEKEYEGLTDASVTCTVVQMPMLPSNTHILPCYFAASHIFQGKRDAENSGRMWGLYRSGIIENGGIWNQKSASQVAKHNRGGVRRTDPNSPPRGLESS